MESAKKSKAVPPTVGAYKSIHGAHLIFGQTLATVGAFRTVYFIGIRRHHHSQEEISEEGGTPGVERADGQAEQGDIQDC